MSFAVYPQVNCKYKLSKTQAKVNFKYREKYGHYDLDSKYTQILKDTLMVFTNNDTLKFISHGKNTDEISQEAFQFNGYERKSNSYILEVKGYESGSYFAINNGHKIPLWSMPIFNQNGTQVVTYSAGILYDANPNGIQIFNINNGNLTLQCSVTFPNFEIFDIAWTSKNKLFLKTLSYSGQKKQKRNYLLTILDTR